MLLLASLHEMHRTLRVRILGRDAMTNRIAARNIKLKRVYEESAAADGTRVLVDRLWPRGLKKADAAIDRWIKDLAPSSELRRWFGHDPARWEEFRRRYSAEVRAHAELFRELRDLARSGPVTLLFAARDETHNEAVALRDQLLGRPGREAS
jgi:uncharacterized protein YeaO (DUF488 family)